MAVTVAQLVEDAEVASSFSHQPRPTAADSEALQQHSPSGGSYRSVWTDAKVMAGSGTGREVRAPVHLKGCSAAQDGETPYSGATGNIWMGEVWLISKRPAFLN